VEIELSWSQNMERGVRFKKPLTEENMKTLEKYRWVAIKEYVVQAFIHDRKKRQSSCLLLLNNIKMEKRKDNEVVFWPQNSALAASFSDTFQRVLGFLNAPPDRLTIWLKELEMKLRGLDPWIMVSKEGGHLGLDKLKRLVEVWGEINIVEIPLAERGIATDGVHFLQVIVLFDEIKEMSPQAMAISILKLIQEEKLEIGVVTEVLYSGLGSAPEVMGRLPVDSLEWIKQEVEKQRATQNVALYFFKI